MKGPNRKNLIQMLKQQGKEFSANKEKMKTLPESLRSSGHDGGSYQVEMYALLAHYKSGQYTEAEKLASEMTQKHPNEPFGWKVLGTIFRTSGRLYDAVIANERAVALTPNDEEAHCNLGNALKDLGRLEGAEASYRQAIALKPDFSGAYSNLGNALRDLGRLEEAEVSYRQAISLTPEFAQAHSNLGNALKDLGRLEDAVASYRKSIALKPDFAGTHSNLGITLKDLGQLEEAEASYRQAIALKPDFAEAHSNLGNVLKDLGRFGDALNSVVASIKIKSTAAAKNNFVYISRYIFPESWDSALSEMVISALLEPWARPSDVMDVACRLLKLDTGFMQLLNQKNGHSTQSADTSNLDSFVANPLESSALMRAMLSSSLIHDHELERFFTKLREHYLMQVMSNNSDGLEGDDVPTLYCYLAQQCFINEYVYFQSLEEIKHLKLLIFNLQEAIERGEKISASLVIAIACYVPLHSVPGIESLLQRHWPSDVANVLNQQIQETLDELSLQTSIPSLTFIENTVSLDVKRMYEENPYPRWVKLPKETSPHYLSARIRGRFPFCDLKSLINDRSPEVLIAGCGTGQHPIGTAQEIKGAKVLAIDLSIASLSYAKRKTIELGIENIEYAQADLLKLESLRRTFDVIESVGVLHHLKDPFEGFEILLSLLKPNGLMKLGFYSELARRDIVKVREMIDVEGVGSTAQNIRAYRKHLLELNDSEGFGFATSSGDFFSTSACRDLLFHVQEYRITIPILSNFFKKHNLNFLGFDIDSSVRHSFKTRFPNDLSATDLDSWRIYEDENPDTFVGMYQFWIQKPSALPS